VRMAVHALNNAAAVAGQWRMVKAGDSLRSAADGARETDRYYGRRECGIIKIGSF